MKEYMTELHTINEFDEAKKQREVSVFVFSADWCPDCVFIKAFFPKLIENYTSYKFYYVDRDKGMDIAQATNVMGIPSFVAYYDGKEINRFVSRFRKTEQEIDAFLHELVNKHE